MENHTGQSGNFPKEDPPLKLIVDLCSHLADMGLEFQISLKIKDSLQFSLRSDNKASGQSAEGKRRRGASYRRRQMRRRAAYLEKKRGSPEKGGRGIPYICHFFTQAKFLENKIYTEIYTVNCQFTQ